MCYLHGHYACTINGYRRLRRRLRQVFGKFGDALPRGILAALAKRKPGNDSIQNLDSLKGKA